MMEREKLPLVSFCIPAHNSGLFIGSTLNLLLAQDYLNFEIIVVDDHSTDNTKDVLKNFNSRVKVINADKRGAATARNKAFNESKGEFIVFFDSDDLVSANYLSTQLKKLDFSTESVAICSWGRFYNDDVEQKPDPNIIPKDLGFKEWICGYWTNNTHMTPPGRVLIPRKLLALSGLWDETLSLNDDFDFFARVFSKAKRIHYNDSGFFYYRSAVGGLSSRVKGYSKQLSNYTSILKATNTALLRYPGDQDVCRACANIWQQFIYDNYPENPQLRKLAGSHIKALGGANFSFPVGGWSLSISKLIGWRLFKRISTIASNNVNK
jgi:glycosyltransferase involved in cell wall biosynthesis